MRKRNILAAVLPLFLHGKILAAPAPTVGDRAILEVSYETSSSSSNGSSGSSSGHSQLFEQIVAVNEHGIEFLYDLPPGSDEDARKREWMFPVRVFRPNVGAPQILNLAEMEKRLDDWLASAKWDRRACGHWIFTWNAFRIECDPAAAIKAIDAYDLRHIEALPGASYAIDGTTGPRPLFRRSANQLGVTLDIDPEIAREKAAETMLAVAEMTGQTITLEAARLEAAKQQFSGTVSDIVTVDINGSVIKRERKIEQVTIESDGTKETSVELRTTTREPVKN